MLTLHGPVAAACDAAETFVHAFIPFQFEFAVFVGFLFLFSFSVPQSLRLSPGIGTQEGGQVGRVDAQRERLLTCHAVLCVSLRSICRPIRQQRPSAPFFSSRSHRHVHRCDIQQQTTIAHAPDAGVTTDAFAHTLSALALLCSAAEAVPSAAESEVAAQISTGDAPPAQAETEVKEKEGQVSDAKEEVAAAAPEPEAASETGATSATGAETGGEAGQEAPAEAAAVEEEGRWGGHITLHCVSLQSRRKMHD